ncbi:MAG: hypothetical protein M1837_006577 [Sclerophora amabilis]|nr:MAG: hypothetical protein M1837_006577 [Sclerophora amabilis]
MTQLPHHQMTGLDPNMDQILQIHCICTDALLNPLDTPGFGATIHHPQSALSQMDEWCTRTHAATGLTQAVLASTTTASEAASSLLRYIQRFVPRAGEALLAGNSVHADRAFLAREPYDRVLRHLHYRILDVSSIKEAARRWGAEAVLKDVPRKEGAHEARSDILESIEEARFYKKAFFDER